jgi:putative ABC transport system substrate-binding protein
MAHIRRRQFLTAAAALLASPRVARAQAQKKLPVLGMLIPGRKPPPDTPISPFEKRLAELGWIEGKTLLIERVYAEDNIDRLPELAASLVAKKVDVIWTTRTPGPVAAARATKSIPIVFLHAGFPVGLGLVDSLARPGRNVTGVAWFADLNIYLKRYQLLRELAPGARRVASLIAPSTNLPTVAGGVFDVSTQLDKDNKFDATLRNLGFESRGFVLTTVADLEPVLAAIAKWAPDALSVQDFALTFSARKQIVEFARSHRLIDIYESLSWTEAGGLFSYGTVVLPGSLRTAEMVDRILRGAKPADIPVELPSHFELVVNLATAKTLGLKVPQSILLRADKVIE